MIPSGINSQPVARVIDPVIEILTTGAMITLGTNSPPVARGIDPVIETLTNGPIVPSGTNNPSVDDIHKRHDKLDIYFFITITGSIALATGGQLVPEGSIGPLVSVSITGSITLDTGLIVHQ
jgi:hypothetical protein